MHTGLQNNQPLNEFEKKFEKKEIRELTCTKYRLYYDLRSENVTDCNTFEAYKTQTNNN